MKLFIHSDSIYTEKNVSKLESQHIHAISVTFNACTCTVYQVVICCMEPTVPSLTVKFISLLMISWNTVVTN